MISGWVQKVTQHDGIERYGPSLDVSKLFFCSVQSIQDIGIFIPLYRERIRHLESDTADQNFLGYVFSLIQPF